MNIVIAEDQELIRKSLKIVIESLSDGQVTGLAGNGQEALALCRQQLPDVVLMDIQMPVMNGVEATRQIKAAWPQMKVIILTTFQDIDHVRSALTAGAEGYILKAVDPHFLIKGIELVYRGGSLVPQSLAREIFQAISTAHVEKSGNPYELNNQELKVLKYIGQGLSNKQISEMMFLSVGTVKNYVSVIYSKLNVKNRAAATMKAIEESLIPGNNL